MFTRQNARLRGSLSIEGILNCPALIRGAAFASLPFAELPTETLMKLIIFFISASIFGAAAVEQTTVKIPQWKEFKNLEFTKVEGDYVKFFHSNGISKVLLAVLPLDIQKKLVDLPVEDLEAKEAKQEKERLKLDLTKYRNDFGGVLYGKVIQVLDDGADATTRIQEVQDRIQEKSQLSRILPNG